MTVHAFPTARAAYVPPPCDVEAHAYVPRVPLTRRERLLLAFAVSVSWLAGIGFVHVAQAIWGALPR